MPKIAYVRKTFSEKHLRLIVQANRIIARYQAEGFSLTLRQLYYRFVAARAFTEAGAEKDNTVQNYKLLGNVINDARLAGLVDWEAIEDRTRGMEQNNHWADPSEIVEASANQYQEDKWADQPYRPEIWIEKEALADVAAKAGRALDIPWYSCRGYSSASETWRAARRMAKWIDKGQTPIVFHLGDHDPSGIDMTRDNRERLKLLARDDIEVRRLALNMDQIEELQPPPNPAKTTDSRFAEYAAQYGDESWELDAIEPNRLVEIITEAVEEVRDPDLWEAALEREEESRAKLRAAVDSLRL